MPSATAGRSAIISTLSSGPPPKDSKFRNSSQRNSSGIITNASAPIRTRSSVPCSRASGKPASRKASGSSHRSPSQMPAVSGTGSCHRRSNCADEPDQPDRRASARRRGSPAGASRRPSRWPRTTSRRAGTARVCSGRPSSIATRSRPRPRPSRATISVRRGSAEARGREVQRGRGGAAWPWRDSTRVGARARVRDVPEILQILRYEYVPDIAERRAPSTARRTWS